jgi:hypothetical protein
MDQVTRKTPLDERRLACYLVAHRRHTGDEYPTVVPDRHASKAGVAAGASELLNRDRHSSDAALRSDRRRGCYDAIRTDVRKQR